MESFQIYECQNCGEILGYTGKFCSDECEHENAYINRTCGTCGGEFWDGGTSCDCEDWEDEEENGFGDLDFETDDDELEDDLPF